MRRIPTLLAVIGLVAAACTSGSGESTSSTAAASISSSSSSTTAPTTTTPPPDGFGGEVTIGIDGSVSTLNPFAEDAFSGTRIGGNLVWALVYDIDPETWERVPDTVVSLPSVGGGLEVSDDGTMTVTYEVRSGATWSDGTPVTGADVAFTAEAMRDLAIDGRGGVEPVMATVVETDHVERLAYITFEQPTLAFEDALWIILPSHALAGIDLVTATDGTEWPSGGPFIVDSFDPFGDARFVRNDTYWKTDEQGRSLPYLDAVTVVEATESGVQANEPIQPTDGFVRGDFDVATIPPVTEDLARVEAVAGEGAVLQTVASPIIEQITFQFGGGRSSVNEDSANDSLAYRQAVAHAIDRAGLLEETGVPWTRETPGMLLPVGPSAWEAYPYDPRVGSDLVEGIGSEEIRARLSTTGNGDYRIRIGNALQSRFAAIGVEYGPIYLDSVLFFGETLTESAFDLGMWAWINDGGYASTVRLMDLFDPSGEPPDANFGRWEPGSETADRFTEIAESARTTVDPDEFWALVEEAEQILADELIVVPLVARSSSAAHWSDVVTGVVHNGSRSDLTWNVEVWQRVGE